MLGRVDDFLICKDGSRVTRVDFDERIVNYLVEQFKESDGINLSKDTAAMQRLKEEAEKAKKELSSAMNSNINLPFIAMGKDGPHHMGMLDLRLRLLMCLTDIRRDMIKDTMTV